MNATNLAPQILVGRISSSNKDGILVSLDFFDDVFIPSYLLQAPSEFNSETSLWLWKYGEEDSGDEFVMDIGEQVTRIKFFVSCPQNASANLFPKQLLKFFFFCNFRSPAKLVHKAQFGHSKYFFTLQVRFRVRTIHFTRLTTSFKGVQATTTSEIHNGGVASSSLVKSEAESTGDERYSP